MAQALESSQLVSLRDLHFSLKDGLKNIFTAMGHSSDSEEASQESESFISPKSISRLLIERGEYPAVPICFQHSSKAAAGWSEWVNSELKSRSRKTIVEAGVAVPLLLSSFCDIFKNDICLRHVVRRWSPQTHTFVCSWGEFTPTLEDVYNIMRLPITGDMDPFDVILDEGSEEKLKILQEGTSNSRGKFEFSNWVRYFWGSTEGDIFKNGEGFCLGCSLEAMLAYWLSKYIFTDFPCGTVQQRVLPLAVVLATGARLPLASLFLGRLYRMLDLISNDEKDGAGCYGVTSSACITFLQVFIWERFKGLVVEPVTPEFLRKLEGGRKSRSIVKKFPLCCRWFRRRAKKDAFRPAILDDVDKFIFRPYSSIPGFEVFPFYYPEDQSWACPGLTSMLLTTTLHHIPTYGDRFEPVVVRYSPHRVRRQFGINQDLPAGGFVCRTARAVIVSFIKHDENSRRGMFPNCLGTKGSVGIPTPGYRKFWEFQLHKFGKFVGTRGTMPRRPGSPNKNKRLIPNKSLKGKMSKLNLTYVEVYSNGVEYEVGHSGRSASGNSSRVTATRLKSGNNSGSREPIMTSEDGKKKGNGKVHHFKSKASKDHISFTSASGVRMVLPPNALPFEKGMKGKEKGVKRKVVSSSKTSCVPTKRNIKQKAILSDIQGVGSGDDGAGLEVQSSDDGAGLEVQSSDDGAELEVQSGDDGAGLDLQSEDDGGGLEAQSGGMGLEVQSEDDGGGLEVQSGCMGLEVQSEDDGAGLEVQSDGMEMNLPVELSQDRPYSFIRGFSSFCGRPGGFSLSSAVRPMEVDNSNNEDIILHDVFVESTDMLDPSYANHDKQDGPTLSVIGEFSEEVLRSSIARTSASVGGEGSTDYWAVRLDNFMARFESRDRSSITLDITPSLSGNQSLFEEGRKVPSEFVIPLTNFAEKYGGGSLSSLFEEEKSPHQRHILTKELGSVLFLMENEEVKTEESFLVWRDMCRDMMNWGLKVEFMLDHLKQAARNFFGYMLKPVGSEDCCMEVCRLQRTILELKNKLSNLEPKLGEAQEELHSKLGGTISSNNLVCILRSSWTSQSRAIHGLY